MKETFHSIYNDKILLQIYCDTLELVERGELAWYLCHRLYILYTYLNSTSWQWTIRVLVVNIVDQDELCEHVKNKQTNSF